MPNEKLNENSNENNIESGVSQNDIIASMRKKLDDLRAANLDPYAVTEFPKDAAADEIVKNFDEFSGKTVRVAGRFMSKRVMGKASFGDLQDESGRIQIYVKRDNVGEAEYDAYKKLDIGDIIGVEGEVFKTHKEEISISARKITLLSKALRPLPEKFHGLRDTDSRYRNRSVDLIMNPEVRETFIARSKIISAIRAFLDARGFMEVETPILHPILGGASARPFVTHHNTLSMDLFLRIAPELYLKRLIVGGFEGVYELGRLFRNEGMDPKHNPEFTSIEIYKAYINYEKMMELAEKLIKAAAESVLGSLTVNYQGEIIDFGAPWAKMTMIGAIKEFTGADFSKAKTSEEAEIFAASLGVTFERKLSRGEIINAVFEEKVEDRLISPTFITEYPAEVSPLAKRMKDNPEFTERFELFVAGRELANGFSELNDPLDQRARFEEQVKKRENGDHEACMMDEDFLRALEHAMPPTAGIGIGIDRLVMLLTNSASIRDVLLFPTMKI